MPKVVCSTTEWVLTIRLSEIISKKDAKIWGFREYYKPNLRDHPKSCPNDRMTLLGYGFPEFRCILIYAPWSPKPANAEWNPCSKSPQLSE